MNITGIIASDTYVARDQIFSNGTINLTESVYFQAGQNIELDAGFETQLGAQFIAVIKNCQ